jgi:hypothetical protein
MAEQSKTQRSASGHKAAATRKRNAAKRTESAAKTSARRTRASADATVKTSARATSRNAKRSTKQAGRAATHRFDAASERVEELGRRAQRVLYIQVGAAASVRDSLVSTVRTYTDVKKANVEFNKLERRGARALRRPERAITRQRRNIERDVQRQANGLRSGGSDLVERVKQLV